MCLGIAQIFFALSLSVMNGAKAKVQVYPLAAIFILAKKEVLIPFSAPKRTKAKSLFTVNS